MGRNTPRCTGAARDPSRSAQPAHSARAYVEVFSLYVEIWEGVMALAAPTRIADLPVPSLRIPQPTSGRTFLATCVDEAIERRAHPWDSARLHREWVEQKLNAIEQRLAGTRARSKAAPKPRSLSSARRNIQQVMEAL